MTFGPTDNKPLHQQKALLSIELVGINIKIKLQWYESQFKKTQLNMSSNKTHPLCSGPVWFTGIWLWIDVIKTTLYKWVCMVNACERS